MKTTYLSSAMGTGLVYVEYAITYADLTTAGTAQNITLFTPSQPKFKIMGVTIKHSTAFAGTGPWTTCTVSVGTAVAPTAYASAFDIFQAVGDFQDSAQYKSTTEAATAVIARFTASHNVNVGTAGSVYIRVLYLDITTP